MDKKQDNKEEEDEKWMNVENRKNTEIETNKKRREK